MPLIIIMVFFSWSDWIRSVQNGSNLIKFEYLTYQKVSLYKVVTFIMRINMVNFFGSDQIKSVQNGSNLSKMDQTWSNLDLSPKMVPGQGSLPITPVYLAYPFYPVYPVYLIYPAYPTYPAHPVYPILLAEGSIIKI